MTKQHFIPEGIEGKTRPGYCGVFAMPLVGRHGQLHAWQTPTGALVVTEGEFGRTVARASSKGAGGTFEMTTWRTVEAKGKGGMGHTDTVDGVLGDVAKIMAKWAKQDSAKDSSK